MTNDQGSYFSKSLLIAKNSYDFKIYCNRLDKTRGTIS